MNDDNPTVPKHVGIIMDGNRRWAVARGLQPWRGHGEGQETLHRTVRYMFQHGVKYLTVYAFSTENWKRSEEEVGYLMRHVSLAVKKYIDEFEKEGIRAVFLGARDNVPKSVLKAIDEAETRTAHNTRATLGICLNYGGQLELANATCRMMQSGVAPELVTPELLAQYLYAPELPPIDLVIRTGGEERLSNFMLWRAAYAELYFTDVFWPDFDDAAAQAALDEYAHRQRRFGS